MRSRFVLLLSLVGFVTFAGAACGSSDDGSVFHPNDGDGGTDDGSLGDGGDPDGDPFFDTGPVPDANDVLILSPLDSTIVVSPGMPVPTVPFKATFHGAQVAPVWTIDRGEIGVVNVSSGVFTPAGTLGGKATISANYLGNKAATSITVKLLVIQNGASTIADAGAEAGDGGTGAGGIGGVGGEGPGGPVSDPGDKQVLLGAVT